MKNFIKQSLLGLALSLGLTLHLEAAQITTTVAGNSVANILVGGGRLQQFVLTSTSATNNTLAFVDSPTTNLTYVLGAYSNTVSVVGLYTNIYTNYFGNLTTNIYTAQTTTTNSVPSVTNSYNGILTAQVTANTTLTIGNAATFPYGSTYYFYQGVAVTNAGTGSAVVTLTYQQ
jgi:hypothetical protein